MVVHRTTVALVSSQLLLHLMGISMDPHSISEEELPRADVPYSSKSSSSSSDVSGSSSDSSVSCSQFLGSSWSRCSRNTDGPSTLLSLDLLAHKVTQII